jgi:hypothetical protein
MKHQPDCHGHIGIDGQCIDVCMTHHRCEPERLGDYLLCSECWHVYRTAEELQQEYVSNAPPEHRVITPPPADEIAFCPLCLHDF